MTRLVHIAFQPICHGHYLQYIIDRFSKSTPEIKELPFEENGISHKEFNNSGFVHIYHPTELKNSFTNVQEPHIFITVEEEDLFFLHRLAYTRPDGVTTPFTNFSSNNSTTETVSDFFIRHFEDKFKKYYNLELHKSRTVPKFILRDFFKINYLDIEQDSWIKNNQELKEKLPSNTYSIPLKDFWDIQRFVERLKKCSNYLNLQLDINESLVNVHRLFLKKLHRYETKNRVLEIIESIKNNKKMDISRVDILEEAQLSAWIEKNYEFITIPLTNNFFSTVDEIIQYVENFPQHYKAMNPNLPTFNGIPNPFHLWNLKK